MHSRTVQLRKLKNQFQIYSEHWHLWVNNSDNGLNEIDVYIIEVFKYKNFTITLDDLVMFYCRLDVIKNLVEKLAQNQNLFQQWMQLNSKKSDHNNNHYISTFEVNNAA